MGELIGYLLLFLVIAVLAFYVGWIVLACLARVFSFVIVYACLTFLIGGVAGLVTGAVVPIRVFAGRSGAEFRQFVPADLVAGEVVSRPPRGPNSAYGWDDVWPNYMPYQAREDARAVARELARVVGGYWRWFVRSMPGKAAGGSGGTARRAAGGLGRAIPRVGWTILILPSFVGFAIGTWASAGAWFVIMGIVGGVTASAQQIALWVYRAVDIGARRRLRATAMCHSCYGETKLPGYRCRNDACSVVHWTMLPGPVGLFSRRCSCGTRNPNTVSAAARKLRAVCPYCRADLVDGSGGRQTVQIAMMGSIGAGKSRLLNAFVVELQRAVSAAGGAMAPLNDRAHQYADRAAVTLGQHAPTVKTQRERPEGLPFLVERGQARVEVQILDAAGESFASWDDTAQLRYLDTAGTLVFALDPLGLPQVSTQLQRSAFANSILVATGDQEEAYAAAVDRLRAESVPVGRRALAVVLTKADILLRLPVGRDLDAGDSAAIRAWLVSNGNDLLVRRFEKDFRTVRFFVVDSMTDRGIVDRSNPWWVVDWVLGEARSPLRIGVAVDPPVREGAATETKTTEEQLA
jgi:hypothetical protein